MANSPENGYRAKYLLLKALAIGQTSKDKSQMIPVLKEVIAQFPGSMEEKKAKELIEIQEKGYSKFELKDFEYKSIYKYEENETHWIVLFVDENQQANNIKAKIADFSKEEFNKDRFTVVTSVFGKDKNIILIKEMSEGKAFKFLTEFRKSRKVQDLQDNKIFMITPANFKILFDSQNLSEYENFAIEYY